MLGGFVQVFLSLVRSLWPLSLRYLRISLWAVKLFASQLFLTLIGLTTRLEDNEAILTSWHVVSLNRLLFLSYFCPSLGLYAFVLLVPGSRRNARREIQETRGAPWETWCHNCKATNRKGKTGMYSMWWLHEVIVAFHLFLKHVAQF